MGVTRQGFDAKLPVTPLGRWSLWLAAAFVVLFALNSVFVGVLGTSTNAGWRSFSATYMPYYGITMLGVGFAAGVLGLVAIVRQKERSIITLATLVPALFVILLLIGEFASPH